jgi:hypothetical protein
MKHLCAALLLTATACGPARDPTFTSIVQFSAVKKLQVMAGYVYYFEATGFKRVPTGGGMVEPLFTNGTVHDFSVVTGYAYVASDDGLYRIPTAMGAAVMTITQEKVVAVAADDFGLSWLTCLQLNHAALDGTQKISTPLGSCNGDATLALDSSTAYGSGASGDWFASRNGDPIHHFSTLSCSKVTAGAGWVYCISNGLQRINPLTGDAEMVMDGDVHDFTLSPSNLYTAVGPDLDSQPRSGGVGPTVLGTYASISAVAVDDQLLYFVNTAADMGLLLSTAL